MYEPKRPGMNYEIKVPYRWEDRAPYVELPFPQEEYERRLKAVRDAMAAEGMSALVVYGCPADDAPVRWLSNFTAHSGQTCIVVPVEGEPVIFSNWILHGEPMHSVFYCTWFREAHPAPRGAGLGIEAAKVLAPLVGKGAKIGVGGLAYLPGIIMDALREGLPDAAFVNADLMLTGLRAIKSPLEIEMVRQASLIAGQAIRAAMEACQPGVTEFQVTGLASQIMHSLGAEGPSFEYAVVAGPRSGLKHGPPTGRPMQRGDMVFLDMGARVHGYCSDLSRCVVVGEPNDEQLRMLETAERMFDVWIRHGRPGMKVRELQALTEEIALSAGYAEEYMPLGYGHGLGVNLFELPSLAYQGDQVLEPGMTFALEPMLVRLGFGTAVMEDTILVTETGLEPLSGQPNRIYWKG